MSALPEAWQSQDRQRRLAELYERAGAARIGLARHDFDVALASLAEAQLGPWVTDDAYFNFLSGLQLQDLALARACAAGIEPAWDEFLHRFREKLYAAARAITRDDFAGRDLADWLYAELYGATERDGIRPSKLLYYGGRGSLEGWLRTVLAQEHVNRLRQSKRTVSLEAEEEAGRQFAAPAVDPMEQAHPDLLSFAVDAALASLSTEERFIVASYYLDGRTLAQIGALLHVHESTVSRRLERSLKGMRAQVKKVLCGAGLSRAQATELMETDPRQLETDVRKHLTQERRREPF